MYKIFYAIIKELRLLQRDLLGFAIIFLMPVVLIITITYIQNSVENSTGALELPILVANKDDGGLSRKIIDNLKENNNLNIISEVNGQKVSSAEGKELIKKGEQKILIVIPEDFSNTIDKQTSHHVAKLLSKVAPDRELEDSIMSKKYVPEEVEIYFDPAINANIRLSLKGAIENMISKLETKSMYSTFEKEFDTDLSFITNTKLIVFKERSISINKENIVPNAVQHNLPAWTLFAIFFIILPLSINIVKEKNQGTYVRLKTLPVPFSFLMISKIIVYLFVCMIQFYLMLLVSIYLFPTIGLPALDIQGKFLGLSTVALFSGLAAIGFGVLIGTLAKTHEQAAPFGATSVVILAAVGGLWFPVFAMPHTIQMVAKISPMNWGLEGFYNVLLRDANFMELTPYLLLLLGFFLVNIIIAIFYEKKINQI